MWTTSWSEFSSYSAHLWRYNFCGILRKFYRFSDRMAFDDPSSRLQALSTLPKARKLLGTRNAQCGWVGQRFVEGKNFLLLSVLRFYTNFFMIFNINLEFTIWAFFRDYWSATPNRGFQPMWLWPTVILKLHLQLQQPNLEMQHRPVEKSQCKFLIIF